VPRFYFDVREGARFAPATCRPVYGLETAVLAAVVAKVLPHGRCTLGTDHIAALAGVSRTTVKNALRIAQALILSSGITLHIECQFLPRS
jgi:hypothetical protein